MKRPLEFFGRISSGKLSLNNRKVFEQTISSEPDCDVEIVVKKKGRRSNQQNRYYWGVVVWMIRQRLVELGHSRYSSEDIHSFLKDRFNGDDLCNEHGELIGKIGQSTIVMSKTEFGEYIDRICQWAGETLSIYIPPPNANNEINL